VSPAALIDEATRRSGVVWVTPAGDGRAHALWHLWHDGRMYVVTGGLEQSLPTCSRAVIAVRSKAQQAGVVVRWVAEVEAVEHGSARWDEVVPLLHARRLNAPDGEDQPARWARESQLLAFTPTGELAPLP